MPKLYLPSTFQASDIELLGPKTELNIFVTKSQKCDHIYKVCLYILEENNCLITKITPMLKIITSPTSHRITQAI